MKQITFLIFNILFLVSCNSESIDQNNVELFRKYSGKGDYEGFFAKGSEKPYTGKLISKSNSDEVIINFIDGKMDGDFLRTNLKGDTLEYREYKNGEELYFILYNYYDGLLVKKEIVKHIEGNQQDKEIFIKFFNLIKARQYDELNNIFSTFNSYKDTFEKLETIFGSLQGFEIREIKKRASNHNNSEQLRARVNLIFSKKEIEVGFLIVKRPDELIGGAFSFPIINQELIKDNSAPTLIDNLNKMDIDAIIQMTQLTEQHKPYIAKSFKVVENLTGEPKFLNCHFGFDHVTYLVKDYSVEMNGEKHVLQMFYDIKKDNTYELSFFKIKPLYAKYNVPHKLY